jgi:hypothetical protein
VIALGGLRQARPPACLPNTTMFTEELDSTTEEVEFLQEKDQEAMKTIQKLKCHYPQDV